MFGILFAVALVVCVTGEDSLKSKFIEAIEPRLMGTAIKIQKATEKLEKLKEKLEDAHKYDLYDRYHDLLSRVDNIEGNGCPGWNFQCGGHSRQCISHLLVCDGHDDCDNGADEESDICSIAPVKSGRIFDGHVQWKHCLVKEDHPVRFVITNVYTEKFFTPRARVFAKISYDEEAEKNYKEAKGYYNFGTRTLVLFPQYEFAKHRMAVCTFNMGDNDHADCVFQMKASEQPCATTVLTASK